MSKFDGAEFQVVADGNWYPNPELADDGIAKYACRAFFDKKDERDKMQRKVSIVTWKRPLGTMSIIGHLEAGTGDGKLIVPDSGGKRSQFRAVLTGMTGVRGYGKYRRKGYMADLSFVIISDLEG
jgi:hypothetical protein